MPEIVSDKKVFSLTEVLVSVQKTLEARYTSAFWVKAEMNKLNFYKHSGHCYPELVDKTDGKIVAEIRAVLWNSDYNRINRRFLTILHEPLKDGIKILFLAKIQFDPKYGLSLHILDIDPSFTLGDLEKEKQETIQRLQSENIYGKNRSLRLPLLPQRIAIISVETSKGYADFLSVTNNNPWHYKFFHYLFPSLLQGDRAAASIIAQLKRIRKAKEYFDVVAIIRGGGGEVGLTCYNNYELAKYICEFPLPVITGIGHATNETVAEMVAHTNAITPTKLAEFLIQYFHNFSYPVNEAQMKISDISRRILEEAGTTFRATVRLFKSVSSKLLITQKSEMNNLIRLLNQHSSLSISSNRQHLQNLLQSIRFNSGFLIRNSITSVEALEKNIALMHPDNVLKRGYSITLFNDKSVTHINELKNGDEVKTILSNGSFKSIISNIDTKTKNYE